MTRVLRDQRTGVAPVNSPVQTRQRGGLEVSARERSHLDLQEGWTRRGRDRTVASEGGGDREGEPGRACDSTKIQGATRES